MRDYRLRCKLLEILLKSGSFFKQTFFNQRIVNMLNVNKNQKTKSKTPIPPKRTDNYKNHETQWTTLKVLLHAFFLCSFFSIKSFVINLRKIHRMHIYRGKEIQNLSTKMMQFAFKFLNVNFKEKNSHFQCDLHFTYAIKFYMTQKLTPVIQFFSFVVYRENVRSILLIPIESDV